MECQLADDYDKDTIKERMLRELDKSRDELEHKCHIQMLLQLRHDREHQEYIRKDLLVSIRHNEERVFVERFNEYDAENQSRWDVVNRNAEGAPTFKRKAPGESVFVKWYRRMAPIWAFRDELLRDKLSIKSPRIELMRKQIERFDPFRDPKQTVIEAMNSLIPPSVRFYGALADLSLCNQQLYVRDVQTTTEDQNTATENVGSSTQTQDVVAASDQPS